MTRRAKGGPEPAVPLEEKRTLLKLQVLRTEAEVVTAEAALTAVGARLEAVGTAIHLLREAAREAGIQVSAPIDVEPSSDVSGGIHEKPGAKLAAAFGELIRGAIREEVAKATPKAPAPPPPVSDPDPVAHVPVSEAARMLHCTTRTVRGYITHGYLRGFRVGMPGRQRLLVSRGDVVDFIENGQTRQKVPEMAPQVDTILAKLNSDAA